jgi:pyruvate/2-oxoglutarate dehydrogenase complex dihydrolipoamide acyltransferase (E2) component
MARRWFSSSYVHIGIAVDTPHGLMVPVIRDADRKGLWQIASEIADLAGRAQARKIGPDEMGGASMSISNLGGIGGTAFTPIVNPPEVAILGITRTETVPAWDGDSTTPGADGASGSVLRSPRDQRGRCRALLMADPRRMMVCPAC